MGEISESNNLDFFSEKKVEKRYGLPPSGKGPEKAQRTGRSPAMWK